MKKKYMFSLATPYVNSEWKEEIELQFDDDATIEEIENQIDEIYQEWVNERNNGCWILIE
jgi:hypothetical protein